MSCFNGKILPYTEGSGGCFYLQHEGLRRRTEDLHLARQPDAGLREVRQPASKIYQAHILVVVGFLRVQAQI